MANKMILHICIITSLNNKLSQCMSSTQRGLSLLTINKNQWNCAKNTHKCT